MKTLQHLTLAALVLSGFAAPAFAMPTDSAMSAAVFDILTGESDVEKRKRPRVPGGSGCDDPQDVAEHPECRV